MSKDPNELNILSKNGVSEATAKLFWKQSTETCVHMKYFNKFMTVHPKSSSSIFAIICHFCSVRIFANVCQFCIVRKSQAGALNIQT